MLETFKPEGGLWLIRDTETGETLDRGPFVERKTALRAIRQLEAASPITEAIEAELHPFADPREEAELEQAFIRVDEERNAAEDAINDQPAGSIARHLWLEDALEFSKGIVANAGGELHDKIRVSLGMTGGRKVLGVCFHEAASKDAAREIFISPVLDDGAVILSTLIHEVCHACLPDKIGHTKPFANLAYACGLTGKATATVAGEELQGLIAAWIAERGPYPVGGADPYAERKKQSTRLIKAECPSCGYTVRVTRKWIAIAVPACPDVMCDDAGKDMTIEEGGE